MTTNTTENIMITTQTINLRYRTFEVKYIGATDTKPSRFKITDLRRNKSVIKSYNHEFNSVEDMATAYLQSIGISVDAMAMTENNAFLLSKDFETKLV